jgi:AraC family transcriptional regulator
MYTATVIRFPAELFSKRSNSREWSAPESLSARPPEPILQATAPTYQGGHVTRRQQKSWTGVRATITEVRCDGHVHVDLGSEWTRLSVALEEVGGPMEVRSRPWRGRSASHDVPHPLSLIPANMEAHGQASGIRFMRHLMLQFDGPILARMLEDEIDLSDAFAPRLMFSHPGIMHLAQLFAEECASAQPKSRLYGDTLSVALLVALSRLNTSRDQSDKRGQLAPWQIRRVTDYFFAHLGDDIQLQTVCDLVKLSRSYFSRAFKISTGLAPHQWLLQARIAKAKQLLLESGLQLAQIAVDIGFADQAHFTRTFRRMVGQSPRAWQRAHCA